MPATENERMSIGVLAREAGVGVETIRFYQRRGLLTEPPRPAGGIRRYRQADLSRLHFVKSAKQLGFSLDEILELLRLDDGAHCTEVAVLAAARLADVQARMKALSQMESALSALVRECRDAKGEVRCPLIEALYNES